MSRRSRDSWVEEGAAVEEEHCRATPRTTPPLVPPPLPVISTPLWVVSNLVFVQHQPITWQPCPYPRYRRDAAA